LQLQVDSVAWHGVWCLYYCVPVEHGQVKQGGKECRLCCLLKFRRYCLSSRQGLAVCRADVTSQRHH
jgi:hypothetical protein